MESVPSVNLTAKDVLALRIALRPMMDITFSLEVAARRMENFPSAAPLARLAVVTISFAPVASVATP